MRELTFKKWAETHIGVRIIPLSVNPVGFLPKLERVETFHENPFISTEFAFGRTDGLGHGHDLIARFEVLTLVLLKIQVFWDMTESLGLYFPTSEGS
jgi:hypothetical protein